MLGAVCLSALPLPGERLEDVLHLQGADGGKGLFACFCQVRLLLPCFFLHLLHALRALNGLWDTRLFGSMSPSCCPLLLCANQRLSPSCGWPSGCRRVPFSPQ